MATTYADVKRVTKHALAGEAVEMDAKRMTPSEIAEAEKLACEWKQTRP